MNSTVLSTPLRGFPQGPQKAELDTTQAVHCTRCKKDVQTYKDLQGGQEILQCSLCYKVVQRGAVILRSSGVPSHPVERITGYAEAAVGNSYFNNLSIMLDDLARISKPPKSKCPVKAKDGFQPRASFYGGEEQLREVNALKSSLREDDKTFDQTKTFNHPHATPSISIFRSPTR